MTLTASADGVDAVGGAIVRISTTQ